MSSLILIVLASAPLPTVPDSGSAGLLLGLGILSLGLVARYLKIRKD